MPQEQDFSLLPEEQEKILLQNSWASDTQEESKSLQIHDREYLEDVHGRILESGNFLQNPPGESQPLLLES